MDPSVHSTPQNLGTAAYREFITDNRAGSINNILRVQRDLERWTQFVPIFPLLKAFIAEILTEFKADGDTDIDFLKEVEKEGEQIFQQMLEEAISFCNDEKNDARIELMKHLENFTKQPYEPGRYLPLSNALNTILREFADKRYGAIPPPSLRTDKDKLIFMPNDPNVIESSHLKEDCPKARRKPDIIGVFMSYLCEVDNKLEKKTFKEMAEMISEDVIEQNPNRPPKWSDVHTTLELKVKNRKMKMPKCHWSLKEILHDISKEPKTSGRKRARDTDHQGEGRPTTKSKAPGVPLFPIIHTSILPDTADGLDPLSYVNTKVQCAYYGIERSSCTWHATHSTVVLLEDSSLSVSRYDAQGCIQSVSFDILKELPVLVVMTAIMQRFSLLTWGLTEKDSMKVNVGNKSFCLLPTPTPFQLNGRRTTGTFAKLDEDADEDAPDESTKSARVLSDAESPFAPTAEDGTPDDWKDGMPLFFKSTWTECIRDPEFRIITVVGERTKLLPEKFRKMVTDHIPTIVAAQECKNVSTARFRLFLKFAGALSNLTVEDIQKRARVRVWMVTPRLLSVHKLEPFKFLHVFWDTVRCHYLLWRIGIAHGDISLTNLMCSPNSAKVVGILNDFDLAAIMKPGDRSPSRRGWVRTATLPFMAMDLLEFHDGQTKRWYRHDLESFAWCLLWEMLDRPDIEWTTATLQDILKSKRSLMSDPNNALDRTKAEWAFSFDFIEVWLRSCNEYSRLLSKSWKEAQRKIPPIAGKMSVRDAVDSQNGDADHIRTVVGCANEIDAVLHIPALLDTTWIDVELEKVSAVVGIRDLL